MDVAEELLDALRGGPLPDVRTGEPFSTVRTAGDGVLRVGPLGQVTYATPNAVNIMRLAGVEGALTGLKASGLPGGGFGIAPVLGTRPRHRGRDAESASGCCGYRTIALPAGALVLVEDVTEARRREQELKVKDATIREVHHRVKNNLQTIASLLRIQARRSDSDRGPPRARRGDRARQLDGRRPRAALRLRRGAHRLLAGRRHGRRHGPPRARRRGTPRGRQGRGVDRQVAREHRDLARARACGARAQRDRARPRRPRERPGRRDRVGASTASWSSPVRDDGAGLPEGFDAAFARRTSASRSCARRRGRPARYARFSGGRGTTVTVRVPAPSPAHRDRND